MLVRTVVHPFQNPFRILVSPSVSPCFSDLTLDLMSWGRVRCPGPGGKCFSETQFLTNLSFDSLVCLGRYSLSPVLDCSILTECFFFPRAPIFSRLVRRVQFIPFQVALPHRPGFHFYIWPSPNPSLLVRRSGHPYRDGCSPPSPHFSVDHSPILVSLCNISFVIRKLFDGSVLSL